MITTKEKKKNLANKKQTPSMAKPIPYFAGQLDFTTSPFDVNVFMELHPQYQSLNEFPKRPGGAPLFDGLMADAEHYD